MTVRAGSAVAIAVAMAIAIAMAAAVSLGTAAGGCSRPPPDATPDGALRLWLDKIEASTDDPRAMRDAYALLGPATRKNLEQRALRASLVQGRRVDAEEMLAQGRFGLRFRPKTMTAKVMGEQASVDVVGDADGERATVQCAHEPAGWRVELQLPDPPIPRAAP